MPTFEYTMEKIKDEKVTEIYIDFSYLDSNKIDQIIEALRMYPRINALTINLNIDENDIKQLFEKLPEVTNLEKLDLSQNELGINLVKLFVNNIQKFANLKYLNLWTDISSGNLF